MKKDSEAVVNEITYEEDNLKILNEIALNRALIWTFILEHSELHDIEVKMLDSPCPNCDKFVDSDEKKCPHCCIEFNTKTVKHLTKFDGPGKGRKECTGCGTFIAVRTHLCECGYDFKNKKQTEFKKEDGNKVNNIKKKKFEFYKVRDIANYDLLIKNDKSLINYQLFDKKGFDDLDSLIKRLKYNLNKIVEKNNKLAENFTSDFYGKSGCSFLKREDFLQQCLLAIYIAANHFDETRKIEETGKYISFSTYATYWMKKLVIDEINKREKAIPVPAHVVLQFKNFTTFYNTFVNEHDREPTMEDLKDGLNLSEKKIEGLLFAKDYRVAGTVSMDSINRISDSEEKTNANLRFNSGSLDTFRLTESLQEEGLSFKSINWNKIKFKNDRYREIFYSLRGIQGYEEKTAAELEKIYGITKITINRINEETIEKVKRQLRIK